MSVRHAAESERVQQLTEALDAALLRLDGLLETVGHETQLDDFAQPPPEDLGIGSAVAIVDGAEADASAISYDIEALKPAG